MSTALMQHLASPDKPPRFWQFAGAVIAGQLASMGVTYATRSALVGKAESTQKCGAAFAGIAAFWLIGGVTWLVLTREA